MIVKLLIRRWEQFWFSPVSELNLACCRILMFAYAVFLMPKYRLFDYPHALVYSRWNPVGIFHALDGPVEPATFQFIALVWGISIITALFGLATRVSMVVACISGMFVYGYENAFADMYHGSHLFFLCLSILCFSKAGNCLSLDSFIRRKLLGGGRRGTERISWENGWPLRLAQVAIVLVYFSAGFQKFTLGGGLSWALSEKIMLIIYDAHRLTPFGDSLLDLPPNLLKAGAMLVQLAEISFPLLLIWRRLAVGYAFYVFAFHLTVAMVFGMHHRLFLANFVCFCVFVNWSGLAAKFRIKFLLKEPAEGKINI